MGEPKPSNYYSFFLTIILIHDFIFSGAKSEVYTVGDADEWNTGTNYLTWSRKYNFSVGDTLVFKYVKGQHDACEVTKATFESCDASTGVLAKYEEGDDEVRLTEAKKYWFICDIFGHCQGGMRFAINANNNATIPPSPNKSCASNKGGIMVYVVAFGILLTMCLFTPILYL